MLDLQNNPESEEIEEKEPDEVQSHQGDASEDSPVEIPAEKIEPI
jgi:hypothetical protein